MQLPPLSEQQSTTPPYPPPSPLRIELTIQYKGARARDIQILHRPNPPDGHRIKDEYELGYKTHLSRDFCALGLSEADFNELKEYTMSWGNGVVRCHWQTTDNSVRPGAIPGLCAS